MDRKARSARREMRHRALEGLRRLDAIVWSNKADLIWWPRLSTGYPRTSAMRFPK